MAGPSSFDPENAFDIVFSFDTTGSMSSAIDEVKGRVGDMISRLKSDIPFIRIALVAHGDYCDKDVFYLEQHLDFSSDVVQLQNFVSGVEGTGGGDPEECYEYVLRLVRRLNWAPGSQRILVMIGDSVPHEPGYELNTDNLDWRVEAKALTEMGVKIYGVQAFENDDSTKFFDELVTLGFGQHLKLSEFSNICDIIMAICYREKGAEYLEGYEAEVRARQTGAELHKDLEGMFGALRRDVSNASKPGSLTKSLSAAGSLTPMPSMDGFDLLSPITSPCASFIATSVKKKRAKVKESRREKCAKTTGKRPTTSLKPAGPKYRHLVPKSKFVLGRKCVSGRWNNWKLVMIPSAVGFMCDKTFEPRNSCRKQPTRAGLRKRELFPKDPAGVSALYEVAVQKARRKSFKKYVMFSKICRIDKWDTWERKVCGNKFVQQQIDHVLRNGGFVWIRRFKLQRLGKRQQALMKHYQSRALYKYAWNQRTPLTKPGKLAWAINLG